MLGLVATVFVASIIVYLFYNIKDPEPILGIYKKCGKWYPVKYLTFLILYHYRRWTNKSKSHADASNVNSGHGVKSHSKPEDMDKAQPLSDHPKAFDAAFFIGANKDGFYMAAGSERRQMGIINGLFYFIIPGKGVLCSAKIPDTMLFGAKINEFGAEGLLFTPVTPMKKWLVSYTGKMCHFLGLLAICAIHIASDIFFNSWAIYFKYKNHEGSKLERAISDIVKNIRFNIFSPK